MIKLLILDVDGVLTDGKKYYNRDGDVVMKTFCDKDWTAIKRCIKANLPRSFSLVTNSNSSKYLLVFKN